MNKKGFTLFTALVSFVLILLTAMLVQTMIKAERDRTEVISNIEEQAEMQAMADLTRAEALQTFNYSIRKSIEDYFDSTTGTTNPIEIYPQNNSFEETRDAFADRFFGTGKRSTAFINEMANNLVNSFPGKKFIGPYEISIELKGADADKQREKLRESLKALYLHSIQNGNFFEVVDCENGDPENCLGTFYLNLRTSDLSDEIYEMLPQIKVRNYRTQRVLQESIFPRGNIKFYVPIRLFKVMAEARSLALEYGEENGNAWKGNYGLFSLRIHNEIEEMKLGMCDPGYCNPRTNPYVPPEEKNMEQICPNPPASQTFLPYTNPQIICTSDLLSRGMCSGINTLIGDYNPNTINIGNGSQQDALEKLVARRLCDLARKNILPPTGGSYLDQDPTDSLLLENNISGLYDCEIYPGTNSSSAKNIFFSFNSITRNSVKIEEASINTNFVGVGSATKFKYTANDNYSSSSSDCPMTSQANSTVWGTYGIGIDSQGKIEKKTITNSPCNNFTVTSQTAGYAGCSEISKITLNIALRETNQNYIVDKTKKPVYVVILIDDMFTPQNNNESFHQQEKFSMNSNNCALDTKTPNSNCNKNFWTCTSIPPQQGVPGSISGTNGGCQIAP